MMPISLNTKRNKFKSPHPRSHCKALMQLMSEIPGLIKLDNYHTLVIM